MSLFNSVLLVPLILASLSLSNPIPAPLVGPPICSPSQQYTVSSKKQVDGQAFTGGTSVGPGQSANYGGTHSVSTTVTVGISLGLDIEKIFHLGEDTSVSITTGNAVTESGDAPCPASGPWTCAVKVTPSLWQVDGQATGYGGGVGCGAPPSGPYTIQFPIIDPAGNAVVNLVPCTCPDYPNASVPGGPVLCPGPCKTA